MGACAKLLVERGGHALLAETDELMGAEPYVLDGVRDAAVQEKFLVARGVLGGRRGRAFISSAGVEGGSLPRRASREASFVGGRQ